MNAVVLLLIPFAAVMAAPATPNNDQILRALINPRPEMIQQLNDAARSLQSSLAASSPEAAVGTGTAANLNLGGLNNIILAIIRRILEQLASRSSSPQQPTPSLPSGTGTGINQPTSTNALPNQASPASGILRLLNPLRFLSSGNMMYQRMMSEMMENFFEFF